MCWRRCSWRHRAVVAVPAVVGPAAAGQQPPPPPAGVVVVVAAAAGDVDLVNADDGTAATVDRVSLSDPATTPRPPSLPKHHDGAPTWLHYTALFRELG